MKLNMSREQLVEHIQRFIVMSGVNEDQAAMLRVAGGWFDTSDTLATASHPVTLVHGGYGSGKSHLMTLLIQMLDQLVEIAGDPSIRILVTAHTNVAGVCYLCTSPLSESQWIVYCWV